VELGIDIDAAVKLAHWGLLRRAPALLGIELADCFTLTSLEFRAKKALVSADGKVFQSTDAAQAVLEFIVEIGQAPDTPLLPELQDVSGIDAGEAVLLSAIAADPRARLLTGDKRALKSLAICSSAVRERFTGRIVIVEEMVLAALNHHGLTWLRERICPHRAIDKTIGIVMGSRCDANEAMVREALESYINEIRSLCTPSLIAG